LIEQVDNVVGPLTQIRRATGSWSRAEDFAPLEVRLSWVRTMTQLFILGTAVSLAVHAWGGAAIAGPAAVFGLWRWRRLRRLRSE
jgi:hypothetical protein